MDSQDRLLQYSTDFRALCQFVIDPFIAANGRFRIEWQEIVISAFRYTSSMAVLSIIQTSNVHARLFKRIHNKFNSSMRAGKYFDFLGWIVIKWAKTTKIHPSHRDGNLYRQNECICV